MYGSIHKAGLLASGLILLVSAASAQTPDDVALTAPPEWVEPLSFENQMPDDSVFDSEGKDILYLFKSRQDRLPFNDTEQLQSYRKIAYKLLDANGVRDHSRLSIGFRPAYETLRLHTLNILREGRRINAFDTARLRVLQRESQASALTYNGKHELDIVLSDVRIGDVVEYSYSVSGSNPVFGEKHERFYHVDYGVYLHRNHFSLIAPVAESIDVRAHNTDMLPAIELSETSRTYTLDSHEVQPVEYETSTPEWFVPDRYVVFSNVSSWAEVAQWETPLYEDAIVSGMASPEVQELSETLFSEAPSNEAYIAAALQWVQREVRYLGLQIGPDTHRPHRPQEVLRQRFGDCKGKTVLLIALLRQQGIDAHPALVHTERGRSLSDFPERLHAFDHVLVHVEHEGKSLWLDPTLANQSGGLGEFLQPDFGYALILDGRDRQPIAMENPTSFETIVANYELTISDRPKQSPELSVTVVRQTRAAESMRSYLSSDGASAVSESYVDYYSDLYGDAEAVAALETIEKPSGHLVTKEVYRLNEFDGTGSDCDCYQHIKPDFIGDYLHVPEAAESRTAPYALEHPVLVEELMTIEVPYTLALAANNVTVENEHFEYSREWATQPEDGMVKVFYRYRSKSDHVPVAALEDYQNDIDQAVDSLYYWVGTNKTTKAEKLLDRWGSSPVDTKTYLKLFALTTIAILLSLAVYWWRYWSSDKRTSRTQHTPASAA